mmetsp:Transcript_17396/g.35633  ORF Transcript_17396/g.35633 Transcript_17396/m.35633 type:complete len:282 (-) Transcript_17396:161-1006(-)
MSSFKKFEVISLLLFALSNNCVVNGFAPLVHGKCAVTSLSAEGFGRTSVKEKPKNDSTKSEPHSVPSDAANTCGMSAADAKKALIDLIPRMTGKDEEYRAVESYVNLLEEQYVPVQTIDFLNLAMAGEWQLLFSTNLTGRPTRKLRLRELIQKVESVGFNGSLTNMAQWDLAEDEEVFDCTGIFNVKCSYQINQGARMIVDLNDHEIRPAKGSKIPSDVPGLVGLLHRAFPKEMFDPSGHAFDTTYLDADLRVVRLTGPHHEGVRNIFMRKGSFEINPASD